MINNMSVGKDYNFVYIEGNTGNPVDFGDVQNLRFTANKHSIKSTPYNGPPRFGYIPDGYSFNGTITRTNSELESFQLATNIRFDSGESSLAGILNETVRNPDGSINRYQYLGAVIWVGDLGDISRETTVKMTFEGMASKKVPLA